MPSACYEVLKLALARGSCWITVSAHRELRTPWEVPAVNQTVSPLPFVRVCTFTLNLMPVGRRALRCRGAAPGWPGCHLGHLDGDNRYAHFVAEMGLAAAPNLFKTVRSITPSRRACACRFLARAQCLQAREQLRPMIPHQQEDAGGYVFPLHQPSGDALGIEVLRRKISRNWVPLQGKTNGEAPLQDLRRKRQCWWATSSF